MLKKTIVGLAFVLTLAGQNAYGQLLHARGELNRVNACLHGQVLDFTKNHGADRRIWSEALCARRDLYVYVPPGFDPAKKYPLAIFLHGAGQDEQFFLSTLVKRFDQSIADGKLPPFIVAAPDGSMLGRPSYFRMATFFANSDAGRYEDYLMEDVWNFLMRSFPLHEEREAKVIIGVSMGGGAAFTQAIKHRDRIKIAVGFMPALNVRWVDCHGRYDAPFDPNCWGWREQRRPLEVVGRPPGPVKIRFHNLAGPLIGKGPDWIEKLGRFNPIEVMEAYQLKPGELDLYAAYGGQDEFNIAAQVESFLYRAKQLGISVGVGYEPNGRHDPATGLQLLPGAIDWISPLVERYKESKN